jgi:hypothetical protein
MPDPHIGLKAPLGRDRAAIAAAMPVGSRRGWLLLRVAAGRTVNRSAGWQRNASQMAVNVLNLMARARPVLQDGEVGGEAEDEQAQQQPPKVDHPVRVGDRVEDRMPVVGRGAISWMATASGSQPVAAAGRIKV